MRTCLACPVNVYDARLWLAGEIQDHQLMLSTAGPVCFVYHLEGFTGWRQFAAVLGRIQERHGRSEWILCRTQIPALEAVLRRDNAGVERFADRWLVRAEGIHRRLQVFSSSKPAVDRS